MGNRDHEISSKPERVSNLHPLQESKSDCGISRLRRAFVLIDAKHGPKPMDLLLLEQLGNLGISYQVVLSKIDRLSHKDDSLQRAFEDTKRLVVESPGVSGLGEVLGVAADPARKGPKLGISGLRWAILRACGIGK
jgi:GTP-binding protein